MAVAAMQGDDQHIRSSILPKDMWTGRAAQPALIWDGNLGIMSKSDEGFTFYDLFWSFCCYTIVSGHRVQCQLQQLKHILLNAAVWSGKEIWIILKLPKRIFQVEREHSRDPEHFKTRWEKWDTIDGPRFRGVSGKRGLGRNEHIWKWLKREEEREGGGGGRSRDGVADGVPRS